MFSADTHVVEPADYLKDIEPEYRERIPRLETRDDGSQWLITEGNRPQRVRAARGPDVARLGRGRGRRRRVQRARRRGRAAQLVSGRTVEQRLADHAADGVDAELMFPNRGLLSLGDARPGVRHGDVPAVEPLDARLLRAAHAGRQARACCPPR